MSSVKAEALKPETSRRFFQLHYRKGQRPPATKIFILDGSLAQAIERAKKHCEKMDYRFCGCYPFIVDLDIQEANREKEDEL